MTDERRTLLLTVDGRGRESKRLALDATITDTILSTVALYTPAMRDQRCVEAWVCKVGDTLADPLYFNPPIGPNGSVSVKVTTFHKDYPQGRVFERAGAVGAPWIRTS